MDNVYDVQNCSTHSTCCVHSLVHVVHSKEGLPGLHDKTQVTIFKNEVILQLGSVRSSVRTRHLDLFVNLGRWL